MLPRFSTITRWPMRGVSSCAVMRAPQSWLLPGVAVRMRMTLVGYLSWAVAWAEHSKVKTNAQARGRFQSMHRALSSPGAARRLVTFFERPKKVTQERPPQVRRPFGLPCAARHAGRLRNSPSRRACEDSNSPRRLPPARLRCSAAHRGICYLHLRVLVNRRSITAAQNSTTRNIRKHRRMIRRPFEFARL